MEEGNRQGHSKHSAPSTTGKWSITGGKQRKSPQNPQNPMSQCEADQAAWASFSDLKFSVQIYAYDITFTPKKNGLPHSVTH